MDEQEKLVTPGYRRANQVTAAILLVLSAALVRLGLRYGLVVQTSVVGAQPSGAGAAGGLDRP